jgi:GTPase SAR1 family protein
MAYIIDLRRKFALKDIENHIKRGDSVLILGEYGTGKTELLKQIKGKASRIWRPRGTVDQVLNRILKPNAKGTESKSRDRVDLEEALCATPRTIIIDEVGDMSKSIWPSVKAIMDSGSPIIMAGKPNFLEFLKGKHEDILSRLTVIPMDILSEEDFRSLAKDFNEDAFTILYDLGNMRSMDKVIKNCRDFADEKGIKTITANIVDMFKDMVDSKAF